jgi:hypothetical protein
MRCALAKAAGAEYGLFEGEASDFPFHAVKDSKVLELGNVTATVVHTPRPHARTHISARDQPHPGGRSGKKVAIAIGGEREDSRKERGEASRGWFASSTRT